MTVARWRAPLVIAYHVARKAHAMGETKPATDADARRLINRSPASLAAYAGTWLAVAVISASAHVTITGESLQDWTGYVLLYGGYWTIWAIAMPLIYATIARVRRQTVRSRAAQFAIHGGLLTLLVLTSNLFFLAYNSAVAGTVEFGFATYWQRFLGGGAVLFVGVHLFKYAALALICANIWQRRRRAQEELARTAAELESQSLAVQLADAKLASLREQLHPHFLFNALNCIASLIEIRRNSDAYAAVSDLAKLLRQTLEMGRRQTVTLREDVEHARSYLRIAELRFGSQLSWRIDMEVDCESISVPPLLLQPLVENSVKHAANRSDAPVFVHICVRGHHDGVEIVVSDDGPGIGTESDASSGTKIGLGNLRERLALIYGKGASLAVVAPSSGRGAATQIFVPRCVSRESPHAESSA